MIQIKHYIFGSPDVDTSKYYKLAEKKYCKVAEAFYYAFEKYRRSFRLGRRRCSQKYYICRLARAIIQALDVNKDYRLTFEDFDIYCNYYGISGAYVSALFAYYFPDYCDADFITFGRNCQVFWFDVFKALRVTPHHRFLS